MGCSLQQELIFFIYHLFCDKQFSGNVLGHVNVQLNYTYIWCNNSCCGNLLRC